jgi:hypothetical protein
MALDRAAARDRSMPFNREARIADVHPVISGGRHQRDRYRYESGTRCDRDPEQRTSMTCLGGSVRSRNQPGTTFTDLPRIVHADS